MSPSRIDFLFIFNDLRDHSNPLDQRQAGRISTIFDRHVCRRLPDLVSVTDCCGLANTDHLGDAGLTYRSACGKASNRRRPMLCKRLRMAATPPRSRSARQQGFHCRSPFGIGASVPCKKTRCRARPNTLLQPLTEAKSRKSEAVSHNWKRNRLLYSSRSGF